VIDKTGSAKIGPALLFIGGVFQALAVALHVVMFFGISKSPEATRPLLYIFNGAVLATVIFFAYVSFFRRRELIQTGLGRATCLFIGVFYLQRGLVEVVASGLNPASLSLLCLVAALYVIAPFTPHPVGGVASQGVALDGASSN
jgi:hypothetical protein